MNAFFEMLECELARIIEEGGLPPHHIAGLRSAVEREIERAAAALDEVQSAVDAEYGPDIPALTYMLSHESFALQSERFLRAIDMAERHLVHGRALQREAVLMNERAAREAGLQDVNGQKIQARYKAIELALRIWDADHQEQIRVAECAQLVWNELVESRHRDALPNDAAALKDWIRPVAPLYAKQPGRPRKAGTKS